MCRLLFHFFSDYVTRVLEKSHKKMNVKCLKDKHLNPCDSYNLLNDENLDQNMHAFSDQHSPLTGEEWKH